MIWRCLSIVCFTLLCPALFAAEAKETIPEQTITEQLMTSQTIIGSGDILRGRFTEERQLEGFNGPMRSEGHFVVAPGHGVIWSVEKPFVTTTVMTPAGLVQLIDGKPVMHLSAQKLPFMLHLYDALGGALAGNWQALEADFDIARKGDVSNWEITMVPRKADTVSMPFSSITVKGHRFVERVEMIKTDGGSDIIHFSKEDVAHASPTDAEAHTFVTVSQ